MRLRPFRVPSLPAVGDMVGVVSALGEKRAIIMGHDWGATVAWQAALGGAERQRGVRRAAHKAQRAGLTG